MSTIETKSNRIKEPENESRVWRGPAEKLIIVKGSIEERDVNKVINTGITQSIISSCLVNQLGERCVVEPHGDLVCCLNGLMVKSNGLTSQLTVGFPRVFNPREYIMQFMVIGMKWEAILGLDFFETSKASINLERHCLIFSDEIYREKTRIFDKYGNMLEDEYEMDNIAVTRVERWS